MRQGSQHFGSILYETKSETYKVWPDRSVMQLLFATLFSFGLLLPVYAQLPDILIDPNTPAAFWFAAATAQMRPPVPQHGFADLPKGQIGWLEFNFDVSTPGWRRIELVSKEPLNWVGIDVDPPEPLVDKMAVVAALRPHDWIWLDTGRHRLRVSGNLWSGMTMVSQIRLISPDENRPRVFRVLNSVEQSVAAIGQCAPMRVLLGGANAAADLFIEFRRGGILIANRYVSVPASANPVEVSVDVPCAVAGDISVLVAPASGQTQPGVIYSYSVFDTRPVEPEFRDGRLVVDIDPTSQFPDYVSGDATKVINSPIGSYRESGDAGAIRFARRHSLFGEPSWFAYRINGLTSDKPYLLEVTYPDNAVRVMVAAVRDISTRSYPTSIGAETGKRWPLSYTLQRMSAVFWPASSEGRVIIFNVNDNMRAAVSRIRIYAVEDIDSPARSRGNGNRDMAIWNEEGDNFRNIGGLIASPSKIFDPVDRYLRLVRSSGATLFSPTAVIYSYELFPSTYNLAFNEQRRDLTAAFLLGAEHYNLRVLPELHPRADELLWPARDEVEINKLVLLSGIGASNVVDQNGQLRRPPFFNPLNPGVRRWYHDMIIEFARRYRNYPTFAGVQLRLSQWVNSSLNNLVSIDWGYDAATVSKFFIDTGIPAPSTLNLVLDTTEAAKARHDALLLTFRSAWIEWRCRQIRDIFSDITRDVRKVRSDLIVSVNVFALGKTGSPEAVREMGIDPDMLAQIPGLEIVDSRFAFGNMESNPVWEGDVQTEFRDPQEVKSVLPMGRRLNTITPMQYIEIPGNRVWPSEKIGLPKPEREPWISSASEPSGRLHLARYATLVGLFDAYQLGSGGNGYVFGGEGVAGFMREFTALPRQTFSQVANVPEPLMVRSSDDMFYVVNLSPTKISAKLQFATSGRVWGLAARELISEGDKLEITLAPYELRSLRCDGCGKIVHVELVHF